MVTITIFSLDEDFREWYRSVDPEIREDVERVTGVVVEDLDLDGMVGVLSRYVKGKKIHFEREREVRQIQEEREFQLRIEQTRLETLRLALSESLGQLAEAITAGYTGQLDRLVAAVQEGVTEFASGQKELTALGGPEVRALPPVVTYTNCVRRHDPTEEFPAGRPGPDDCIQTVPQEDGIHMRCLIAYSSQNPGDQGFARLSYQIFHAELLRQGDCPKPLSRNVTRRIPGVSWLLTKSDVCPLASGEELVVEYGGKK